MDFLRKQLALLIKLSKDSFFCCKRLMFNNEQRELFKHLVSMNFKLEYEGKLVSQDKETSIYLTYGEIHAYRQKNYENRQVLFEEFEDNPQKLKKINAVLKILLSHVTAKYEYDYSIKHIMLKRLDRVEKKEKLRLDKLEKQIREKKSKDLPLIVGIIGQDAYKKEEIRKKMGKEFN